MDFFQIRDIIQNTINESSYESDIDPNAKIIVKGVKGMNSKKFTKKFKNMAAADKWMDDNEDDIDVHQVMNEKVEKDEDDPCWDGYVQLGTKKKDGKEVPNCVPMDEALQEAQRRLNAPLHEKKKNADQLEVGDSILMGSEDTPYKIVSIKKKDSDGPGTQYDAEVEGPDGKKKTMLSGQVTMNEQKSGDDEAYEKFFNKALDKFNVSDPSELSKEKKKEFFNYVDDNWTSDKEM